MPNLAATLWKGPTMAVVIVVQNDTAPSDDEWGTYIQIMEDNMHLPNSHGLAITDGGGPTATQRARVSKLLAAVRGRKVFSAVVSGSLMIRGLVGALRLFHRETEAFPPSQIQDAMRFIGLPESQWGSVWTAVMETNAKIAPQSTVVEQASKFVSAR